MDEGLPVVPVVMGVLLVYAGHLAYTLFHHIHRTAAPRTSGRSSADKVSTSMPELSSLWW
jgi:hypothetical protein